MNLARRIGIALAVVGGLMHVAANGVAIAAPEQAATAQAASQPVLSSVTVVRVKPDMVDQWVEFQTKQTIPALKKAGVQQRDVWQSAFGNGFEYRIVQPMAKLADRDQPSPIVRALGEAGAREYNAANRKLIAGNQTFIIESIPDASFDPNPNAMHRVMVLSLNHIAPGRANDYVEYLKNDIVPVQKKAQTKRYLVNRVLFGGDGNEIRTATFVDNFADLDAGSAVVRVLGQQGAATLGRKIAGIVLRAERMVYVHNDALSFRSQTTSSR